MLRESKFDDPRLCSLARGEALASCVAESVVPQQLSLSGPVTEHTVANAAEAAERLLATALRLGESCFGPTNVAAVTLYEGAPSLTVKNAIDVAAALLSAAAALAAGQAPADGEDDMLSVLLSSRRCAHAATDLCTVALAPEAVLALCGRPLAALALVAASVASLSGQWGGVLACLQPLCLTLLRRAEAATHGGSDGHSMTARRAAAIYRSGRHAVRLCVSACVCNGATAVTALRRNVPLPALCALAWRVYWESNRCLLAARFSAASPLTARPQWPRLR